VTAALVILAAVVAIAYRLLVHPVLCDSRARRKQEDAIDEAQATAYWDALEALNHPVVDTARHARTASDLPHGTTRRGTHL
jgi:hypothetical protein